MAQRPCKWSSMYWNVVSMLLSTLNVSWVFKVKTTLIIIWFRFQRWKPIVGSMLNNDWWKLQLEFNHSSTLKHNACVLINLLRCSFWHCLFQTCTLPESFQMLWFFLSPSLFFWCFVLGSCLHIVTIVSHIYSFLFLIP